MEQTRNGGDSRVAKALEWRILNTLVAHEKFLCLRLNRMCKNLGYPSFLRGVLIHPLRISLLLYHQLSLCTVTSMYSIVDNFYLIAAFGLSIRLPSIPPLTLPDPTIHLRQQTQPLLHDPASLPTALDIPSH